MLIPQKLLKKLVDDADVAAVENVREGRGGPFAASLNIISLENGHVLRIGEIAGNAVLETGIGSAHAEDQALSPENVRALKANLKNRDTAKTGVIVATSGEACPACHTKLEILARILVAEGLLMPGHFVVAYGATYADTLQIAGFNDEPYHADMTKPEGSRLIAIETMTPEQLPDDVRNLLPAAIVMSGEGLISGHDERTTHFTFTPEVTAIRAACHVRKKCGADEPWDLKRTTLYSTSTEIGPLAYAEAQWANIARWVRVVSHHQAAPEAPAINNDALFRVIAARPYNQKISALHMIQVTPFDNKAQHEWTKNPHLKNYNGVST